MVDVGDLKSLVRNGRASSNLATCTKFEALDTLRSRTIVWVMTGNKSFRPSHNLNDTKGFIMKKSESSKKYKVQSFVAHGFYEYEVTDIEKAMAHAQAIMNSGVYRHAGSGFVEFHKVYKVKVVGDDLQTKYPDTFKRT